MHTCCAKGRQYYTKQPLSSKYIIFDCDAPLQRCDPFFGSIICWVRNHSNATVASVTLHRITHNIQEHPIWLKRCTPGFRVNVLTTLFLKMMANRKNCTSLGFERNELTVCMDCDNSYSYDMTPIIPAMKLAADDC